MNLSKGHKCYICFSERRHLWVICGKIPAGVDDGQHASSLAPVKSQLHTEIPTNPFITTLYAYIVLMLFSLNNYKAFSENLNILICNTINKDNIFFMNFSKL